MSIQWGMILTESRVKSLAESPALMNFTDEESEVQISIFGLMEEIAKLLTGGLVYKDHLSFDPPSPW